MGKPAKNSPLKAGVYKTSARAKTREIRHTLTTRSAATALGPIVPGVNIFGLWKGGEWSITDAIEHALRSIGPADMFIATWTIAGADSQTLARLKNEGAIRSLRIIVDSSLPSRHASYYAGLVGWFGADAVRLTKCHAKIVVLTNSRYALTFRSSANLNLNSKLEFFELSDDRALASYVLSALGELFTVQAPGTEGAAADETFERLGVAAELGGGRAFGDGLYARDLRRAGWSRQRTGAVIR